MQNNRRWTNNRIFWLLFVIFVVVIISVVVPIAVYFTVTGNRSSRFSDSSDSQNSFSFTRTSTSGDGSQSRTSTPSSTYSSTITTSTRSSVGSTVPTQDLDDVNRELLHRHNEVRTLHGAPNMTWNSELTRFAANYAANNFSCDNVQLIHSGGPYGENLAAGYVGGEDPVDAWYDEIKLYDYQNPGFTEETGHFTQMIWNDSVELGCAIVMCDNAWRQYTICEYYPRGNIVGSTDELTREIFTDHVWPLLDP